MTITSIIQLDKISSEELSQLKNWIKTIEPFMINSVSSSAKGRKELHLRHFVKLASKDETVHEVTRISHQFDSEAIETIGERLAPNFHQALVLYYPKGTYIGVHRDSPAYDKGLSENKGAATLNIIGNATFLISDNQTELNIVHDLSEGDCIRFDNGQPHAIRKTQEDRWCVCFFYLKQEFLPKDAPQPTSRPTKSIKDMTWQELFGNKYTAVFDNKPPLPDVARIKPWKVNIGRYAIHSNTLVKIVGGDRSGKWQIERPPSTNPSHILTKDMNQWVKTSALTQPPKGHETWTDADFNTPKAASK